MAGRMRKGFITVGKQGKKEEKYDEKLKRALDDMGKELDEEARDQQHDGDGASPAPRKKGDARRAEGAKAKPQGREDGSPAGLAPQVASGLVPAAAATAGVSPSHAQGQQQAQQPSPAPPGQPQGGQQGQQQQGKKLDMGAATHRVLDKFKAGGGKDKQHQEKVQGYAKLKSKEQKNIANLWAIDGVTQENAIINDARYAATVRVLKRQLDHALLQRLDGGEKMASLRSVNMEIQQEIARLKGVAQKQAQDEKEVLEQAFLKQIRAKQEELKQEKQQGNNKTEEWVTKNRKRQQELDQMLQTTEAKHVVHRKLELRNKALRVEYSAQGDDKALLLRESRAEKTRNQRLKDRIHELETQIVQMQAQAQGEGGQGGRAEQEGMVMASLRDAREDAGRTHAQKLSKYEEALQRHRQLLATEVRNVQGVRAAHLAALSQRTELEVHLIEAILARQEEIAARVAREQQHSLDRSNAAAPAVAQVNPELRPRRLQTTVFAAADRRRVVEELLSKERVLFLIYQQDRGSLGEAVERDGKDAKSRDVPLELDMNQLWEKWKMWTEAARARPAQGQQGDEEEPA
eukprot:TRINITY_DN9001_c0_g1_i1.p1 TRINITY_DN9001_c0_g1~~TRINITY_DN9001_c0_g1_i1.p1  ORF type:complete len:575 (+),score=277.63 TRINITY_DN9001_c0_g1_i1:90-1814(+)